MLRNSGACKVTRNYILFLDNIDIDAVSLDNLESVCVSCPMYTSDEPRDTTAAQIELNKSSNGNISLNNDSEDYKKLPDTFTDKESWPKSTNLYCPHCDFRGKSIPIIIPKSLSIDRNGRIKSMGVYNGYAFNNIVCANSFLQNNIRDDNKKWEYYEYLRIWASLIIGKVPANLPTVESKLCLKKYGGEYTEAQYINMIKEKEKTIY